MNSYHELCDKVNATDERHFAPARSQRGWTECGMGADTEVLEPEKVREADPRVKRPPMFTVVMLNDDYTPMDFVVEMLIRFFRKSESQALQIMLEVHNRGSAVCGVFPRDIAETKTEQVLANAHREGHPLQCVVERSK